MKKSKYLIIVILVFIFFACNSKQRSVINSNKETNINEDSLFIVQNYEKQEYMVTMRDGIKLYTVVYSPKDKSQKYPILFKRTPYSCRPYGKNKLPKTLGSSMKLARDLYIFVYQDVRGRFMSEGSFVDMPAIHEQYTDSTDIDESTDAWDTIDWLVKNIENNNGKLAVWGNSYPGYYAACACINAHPALVAATPQCPVTDWFWDDFHHNGAFFLTHYLPFGRFFGLKRNKAAQEWPEPVFQFSTPDGYKFYMENAIPLSKINDQLFHHQIPFWDSVIAHPDYDYFWQKMSLTRHLKNIKPAVLIVGGWFDAEDLYGPFAEYAQIEQSTPKNNTRIVIGPWKHGGFARGNGSSLGNVFFTDNPPPSDYYRDSIEFPFIRYYLKGIGKAKLPEALMFETGNNLWRKFNNWPPQKGITKTLFFHTNGSLSETKPNTIQSFKEFISDPEKPVPYTEAITVRMTKEYMTDDQRFAAKRPDVLVYQTDTLFDDITMAGKIHVKLYVSTNQSAADWIVKLIDVYPDDFSNYKHNPPDMVMGGYQQMLRSEVFRGRYRNSFEFPEAYIPNKITLIKFDLLDVLHTFKKGHRIMIQIQSTWFPLIDINPQKYVSNIYLAKKEDFVKAIHRVYSSKSAPSQIKFSIINK